jgi:hypothetical protein
MANKETIERAAQLGVILARALPEAVPAQIGRVVLDLQGAAHRARRASERARNYPRTEAQQARADKSEGKKEFELTERLLELGAPVGTKVALGGDPRGPCGRLKIAGDPGDGWGEGYAIY